MLKKLKNCQRRIGRQQMKYQQESKCIKEIAVSIDIYLLTKPGSLPTSHCLAWVSASQYTHKDTKGVGKRSYCNLCHQLINGGFHSVLVSSSNVFIINYLLIQIQNLLHWKPFFCKNDVTNFYSSCRFQNVFSSTYNTCSYGLHGSCNQSFSVILIIGFVS